MLIDVGRIDQIAVDAVQKTAVAGCGCKLPRLISEIGQHRLDLPLGGGSTVRIGGFVQGGGWGLTSRLFGMNCDSMIEARIMLANGRIVLADETTNYDLWWAMRGGTGGNFGVLLTAKYALHETPDLTSWEVRWELGKPGSSAWLNEAKALAVLQQYYTGADATAVGAAAGIASTSDPPSLWLAGMFSRYPSGRRASTGAATYYSWRPVRDHSRPLLAYDEWVACCRIHRPGDHGESVGECGLATTEPISLIAASRSRIGGRSSTTYSDRRRRITISRSIATAGPS